MSDSPLRIAVIGAGWVSRNRHLPILRRLAGVTPIGVVDRTLDRARSASSEFGLEHWSDSTRLSDVDWLRAADAVAIATPPRTHFALESEALSLGLHVVGEKPFAMTVAEGEELSERAAAAGRVLAIVHNFQFCRSVRRLIADVESGRLGKPVALEGFQLSNPRRRLPTWFEALPAGLFYDESPHLLYLLRRLGGGRLELQSAAATRDASGRSTPAMVTAFFSAGGIPARMTMNFVSPISEWQIAVLGEEQIGAADIFRDIYVRLPNDGRHEARTVLRTSLLSTWRHWLGYVASGRGHVRRTLVYGNDEVFRRFARAVRTSSAPEGISSGDALDVLRLEHEILRQARLS
jgi:scyllo-inositol 2-dehydrogenase (NADP+)